MTQTGMLSDQLAVFIDMENIAVWLQKSEYRKFITPLMDYLTGRGTVVIKRAYGDFQNLSKFQRALTDHSIDLFHDFSNLNGKNQADIRIAIDAFEAAIKYKHINTFVIVSGDSDFSPLMAKLREYGHYTLGIAPEDITARKLAKSCDEFVYLETLLRDESTSIKKPRPKGIGRDAARGLLKKALIAHEQRGDIPVLAAKLKHTMLRFNPAFTETTFGHSQFKSWLEENNDLVDTVFQGLQLYLTPKNYIASPKKQPAPEKPTPTTKTTPPTDAPPQAEKEKASPSKNGSGQKPPAANLPHPDINAAAIHNVWTRIQNAPIDRSRKAGVGTARFIAKIANDYRRGTRDRRHSFSKAARNYALAARMMWEAVEKEEKGADRIDFFFYMASFAASKAGAFFVDDKDAQPAKEYYLAYFYLAQDGTSVSEQAQRFLTPLLLRYWSIAADGLDASVSHWFRKDMTMGEIAIEALRHENPELRSRFSALTRELAKVNPGLVKKISEEMKQEKM